MAKKELHEIAEIAATKAVAKVEERFERYVGALKEDFDHKLDTVLEAVQPIPQIQETLNATFEEVGKLRIDMEIIKHTVKNHEHRIQKLEAR